MDDVSTLVNHIRALKMKHRHMFNDPNKIWNLDKTAVNATYGKRVRVFNSARTNLGGRSPNIKDNGAHVSAVLFASALGFIAPTFFVAVRKKVCKDGKRQSMLRANQSSF